jgi:hypothetical protein
MDLDHGAMFATTCFAQVNISRTTHRGFPTRKTGTEPVTGMVQKLRKTAFFPSTAGFRRPALNRLPHNDAILVKYDNKNNNLRLIPGRAGVIFAGGGGHPMADHLKPPRTFSEEPNAPKPPRPSHQKIIENLDRWVNSSELQPPRLPDGRPTGSRFARR